MNVKRLNIMIAAGLVAIGIFIGVALACMVYITAAVAEDGIMYDCWVVCQPDSFVNIRSRPNGHSEITGRALAGMRFLTDGEEKGGFIHLVDVGNEEGHGWISTGYVVYCEPRGMDDEMQIRGRGRVACRKTIGGRRSSWAKPGDTVRVYWMADGWAVTSRGFIQSEWLVGER